MAEVSSEIDAVKKRYPGATFSDGILTLTVLPTGHLPVPVPRLPVVIHIHESYPQNVAYPEVQDNPHLPPPIVKAVNLVWRNYISKNTSWAGKPMLRHALRFIENRLEDVLSVVTELQREITQKATQPDTAAASTTDDNGPGTAEPAASAPPSIAAAPEPGPASPAAPARHFLPQARAAQPGSPFAGLAEWTVYEHARFETAVREYFFTRGRSWTDVEAWRAVAAAVGAGVSPSHCIAMYMTLQQVVKTWHDSCVAPFRTALAPAPPRPAPAPSPEADPVPAPAAYSPREAKTQQGDRTRAIRRAQMVQPRGEHSSAMHKVPFPERAPIGSNIGADEDEDEYEDRKNPRHVRLYKFFGKGQAGQQEDGEAEGEDEDGEGDAAGGISATDDDDGSDHEDGEDDEDDGEEYDRFDEDTDGDGHGHSHAEDDGEEEVDDSHVAAFLGVALEPEHKGTVLGLDKLTLFGIGTAAATRVHLTAQCQRCAMVVTADLQGARLQRPGQEEEDQSKAGSSSASGAAGGAAGGAGAPKPLGSALVEGSSWRAWCPKCSLLLSLSVRPTLMHDGSSCLCYVDTAGATVTGMGGMWLAATCLDCGAPIESPRLSPPMTWETSCHHCYARVRLEAKGTDIAQASPENAAQQAHVQSARAAARQRQQFAVGKPLPNEGTCKHYKQSYRWLRFPCCDQAFPCDACHDERTDHTAEWAKRMICGHCAREQPFSNAPCVACGGSMRRSRNQSHFWEGGEGQRNRSLLSRKDSRKHAESRLKTRSQKHNRIGAAGSGAKGKATKTYERYHHGVVETVVVKPKAPKR